MALPERTADTMSAAIALDSPSGRMSKRARRAAERKLGDALFGDYVGSSQGDSKVDKKIQLLRRAKELRGLADRGMRIRRFNKEAKRLEDEAAAL
jgi:hypothetical protein